MKSSAVLNDASRVTSPKESRPLPSGPDLPRSWTLCPARATRTAIPIPTAPGPITRTFDLSILLVDPPVFTSAAFTRHEFVFDEIPAQFRGIAVEASEDLVHLLFGILNAAFEIAQHVAQKDEEFLFLHRECVDSPVRIGKCSEHL